MLMEMQDADKTHQLITTVGSETKSVVDDVKEHRTEFESTSQVLRYALIETAEREGWGDE